MMMKMLLGDCESLPGQKRRSLPAVQMQRSPAAAAGSFLARRAQVPCCIGTEEEPTNAQKTLCRAHSDAFAFPRLVPPSRNHPVEDPAQDRDEGHDDGRRVDPQRQVFQPDALRLPGHLRLCRPEQRADAALNSRQPCEPVDLAPPPNRPSLLLPTPGQLESRSDGV